MKRNKRNRKNNHIWKQSKVIRCKTYSKPVFGHEVCSSYSSKNVQNGKKNCDNCNNSF